MNSTVFKTWLGRYGTCVAGLLLFAFFAVFAPNFLAVQNLSNIIKQISFMAILGLGFSLAFLVAELDLSFANVCSLCAVCTGWFIHHGHGPEIAVLAGLLVGVGAGLLNGILVTVVRVPSLIATLATASIANGFSFMVTQGVAFVGQWDSRFLWIGRGDVFGIPALIFWLVLLSVLALFLLKQTRLGFRMLAVGEATEAARLAGINVRAIKIIGLALSGLAAGITAVLMTSSLASASPNSAADLMLTAIAAVLLGMTMFEPGRANVLGTLFGAVIIGMLGNGLILMGMEYYFQDILLGIIIVMSVAFSSSVLKKAAFSI
ncbi:ABC transporter permease [Paracandidimonas soli]|jgi:ribose transport system permease protein|uniref:Monosaccharide ABC transporter membrane protein (CUT2 family) n=1 Tax=Paracandidimonas soli TaxID=1917182 RepID=A0A4R3VD49_9BURK|nr:ABC transporter permease [Paracandidimonas soli]TCV01519.1 monosaccharide ABC transporter membrane protein (CUT2 family) [Paracandidimonas soli]